MSSGEMQWAIQLEVAAALSLHWAHCLLRKHNTLWAKRSLRRHNHHTTLDGCCSPNMCLHLGLMLRYLCRCIQFAQAVVEQAVEVPQVGALRLG